MICSATPARRSVALLSLVSLGALITAIACGGDEGAGDPTATTRRETSVITIATFTPVPPDFTPEALQTRSALQTAYAETATAQPPVNATMPPPVTPPSGPLPTAPPNQIRPPDALLRTSVGEATGAIGSFHWLDVAQGKGADVDAPYVAIDDTGVTWATGTQAQVVVPSSPFAVTGAGIAIYRYEDNMVIPTDRNTGRPIGDRPAFFPQQEPLQQARVEGSNIGITPQVPPGRYVVSVRIEWQTPQGVPEPLYTQYVFNVNVI